MKRAAAKSAPPPTRQVADPALAWVIAPTVRGGVFEGMRILSMRTGSGSPEISDTTVFHGPACVKETLTKFDSAPPNRIVILLPSTEVICRVLTMPSGSAEQLEMALRLQIENLLLGGSARWRTEGAFLPLVDPDGPRPALVVEWPSSRQPPDFLKQLFALSGVTSAPVIAGLVALVTGAIGLGASESMAIDLERDTGGISVAFSNGIHSAFRVLREDGEDLDGWRQSILRGIHEMLVLAEVPEADVEAMVARVAAGLDDRCDGFYAPLAGGIDSFRTVVRGSSDDPAWWHMNGAMAGTVSALGGGLARLCSLRAQELVEHPGFLRQLVISAGRPKTATRLAIAAIMLIALLPPAAAGGRLMYLRWRLPEPEAFARILDRDDEQMAMYRDYDHQAWPMAKLLGDIASTTPEGIELETISIARDAPLTVVGIAKPRGSSGNAADAILQMEEQMRRSGVFDRVEKSWDPPNANGVVKFDLSAAVIKPSLVPNYPDDQDFAKRTLRDRKYGVSTESDPSPAEPAAPTAADAANPSEDGNSSGAEPAASTAAGSDSTGTAAATTAAEEARARRRPPAASSSTGDIARRGRPGAEPAPPSVPEPLTDEQITAMTPSEARDAASRVSTARGQSGVDEATEARLKAEFYKLLERARKP